MEDDCYAGRHADAAAAATHEAITKLADRTDASDTALRLSGGIGVGECIGDYARIENPGPGSRVFNQEGQVFPGQFAVEAPRPSSRSTLRAEVIN